MPLGPKISDDCSRFGAGREQSKEDSAAEQAAYAPQAEAVLVSGGNRWRPGLGVVHARISAVIGMH